MFLVECLSGGVGTASLHSPVGVCEIELLDRRELFSIRIPTDGRNKQLASVAVWLGTPDAETSRSAPPVAISCYCCSERINIGLTSDWRKTVPRHICRHSPINETNGRLLAGTPPRLGMTYVVLVPLQYARTVTGNKKKREKKQNRKELPSLSRNSMSMGLRISLFASLGGSGRLVVLFVPHIGILVGASFCLP